MDGRMDGGWRHGEGREGCGRYMVGRVKPGKGGGKIKGEVRVCRWVKGRVHPERMSTMGLREVEGGVLNCNREVVEIVNGEYGL